MLPEIKICPVKRLYEILAKGEHSKTVAILCSPYGVQEAKVPVPHIAEIFDDVDREIPGISLTLWYSGSYAKSWIARLMMACWIT